MARASSAAKPWVSSLELPPLSAILPPMEPISKGVGTLVLVSAVVVGVSANLHSQTSTQDESAIQQILSGMDDAWNRGDAKAWASCFVPDAELIDVAGTILEGRDAIERRNAVLLGDVFKGSHLAQKLRRLRFLRSDVAVVDADAELYGYQSLPKGLPASGAVLTVRLRYVMVYQNDKWWIVASQNTYVPPPPSPQ